MSTSSRHDRLIAILTVLGLTMAACGSTATPPSGPTAVPPTNDAIATVVLPNEEYGYRLRYPAEYNLVILSDRLVCFTPSDAPGCFEEPGSAWLEAREAGGQTLGNVADEIAAGANPTIEVTRTNVKIGGDDAILLDDFYAADVYRRLVILHNARFYVFTFVDWAEVSEDFPRLQTLYSTLIESLTFLNTP